MGSGLDRDLQVAIIAIASIGIQIQEEASGAARCPFTVAAKPGDLPM